MRPQRCGGRHWPGVLDLQLQAPRGAGMRGRAVADSAAGHVGGVARCILALFFPKPCSGLALADANICAASSDPSAAATPVPSRLLDL